MEFNEKLKELRKQKELTQEELAEALFVSRTAVSKWESGRGYPNIDSLKQLAALFSITVDDLLSGEELLFITEKKENRTLDLIFGLFDVLSALLFFLPFFGKAAGDEVRAVSLLSLSTALPFEKALFIVVVAATVVFGVLTLALQSYDGALWSRIRPIASLVLNVAATVLFVLGRQSYAAIFVFALLIIKAFFLMTRRVS